MLGGACSAMVQSLFILYRKKKFFNSVRGGSLSSLTKKEVAPAALEESSVIPLFHNLYACTAEFHERREGKISLKHRLNLPFENFYRQD